MPTSTGKPEHAAVEWLKGVEINRGQRANLLLFPASDADYTLNFQYYILPEMLTGTNPYVYGGSAHCETILESCKAKAEQNVNDTIGIHTTLFMERLIASISSDRRTKPQFFGRNLDRSDERARLMTNPHIYAPQVTYMGQSFG